MKNITKGGKAVKDFWKLTGEKLRLTGYIILVFIFVDAITSPCIHTVKYLTYPICELHHILFEPQNNAYSYIDGYLAFALLFSNIYHYLLKKIRHGQKPHRIKKP